MAFVAVCAALALLIAFAGLGIDLGRMLVEHRALRTQAKAAALRAAWALDGTSQGLAAARKQAETGAGGRFEKIEFAAEAKGEWSAEPADPGQAKLARVTLRQSVELTLVRAVVPETAKWVRAAAVARLTAAGVELAR